MRNIILLSIILLSGYSSFSQNVSSVTGKVISENNKALPSVTVRLLRAKDSVLVKTAVTNSNGDFELVQVGTGDYLLMTSSIGYMTNYSSNFETAGHYTVEPIILRSSTTSLTAVIVQAKKPMIEVKADKMVFNIENSINATGSNAFELLQKSPGVTTDKDDNISMQGKNGVKIYIDGKPTQLAGSDLAAYLRTVNSADIESIEMITNPSAKYDASGNAGIINIKLKKNKKYGANGNIASGVAFGFTPKYNNSLSLNYRNKKLNIFSNYSNEYSPTQYQFNLYRIQKDSLYDQHSANKSIDKNNNIKAGVDYAINAKNIIGVMVTANFNTSHNISHSNTFISPNSTGIPSRILFANNDLPGTRNNIDYDINFHHADTSGRSLDIDADMVNYKRRGRSYQPNYYRDPITKALLDERIYRNNTPTDIDIYTAKIDYEQPFYKGKLGYGGKLTAVKTINSFEFYNVYGNTDVKDFEHSNSFNYTENVNALYINYNRSISKKITAQAGVRMESTKSEGDLISNIAQADNRVNHSYTDYFPSGALNYKADSDNTFNLSYSRRIDRPGYQDLNPFEDKLDELTYHKGNAFLNPQYTDSYQLSHTFKYKYVTSLSYSHIKDYFAQLIDTIANKSFITQKNLAQQNIFSLNFSAPIKITNWWNSFTSFNGYHSAYKADFGTGKKININVNAFSLYTQQTFSIKDGPTFELTAFYNSPSIWGGTFKSKSMGAIDIGVQQKLLKGSGTVKVSFSDLLNTLRWRGTSDYGGAHLEIMGHFESQLLKLDFSYAFGNKLVKAARQRKAASDDENKRLNRSGGLN